MLSIYEVINMIISKDNEYWGAFTKINDKIERTQILKNHEGIHEIFKFQKQVTFVTNADTIEVHGKGNVGTSVWLWEGKHTVTFSKPDHRTETRNIVVENDMTVTLMLARTHGRLNITSSPTGASVHINNVNMGTTPFGRNNLLFSNYIVSLTRSGYQTDTFGVNFNADGQSVHRNLVAIPVPPAPPTPAPTPPPSPPTIPTNPPNPVNPPECPPIVRNVITYPDGRVQITVTHKSAVFHTINNYSVPGGIMIGRIDSSSGSCMLQLKNGTTYSLQIFTYCGPSNYSATWFDVTTPANTKPPNPQPGQLKLGQQGTK